VPEELANAKQISYWNEQAGPRWVDLQGRLDAQLAPLGEAALDAAALARGHRVLDVGCGCGASSRSAATRVMPGGAVLGVDVSGPMLARAREAGEGVPGLAFLRADAQTHDFDPGAFDAVISRFGVMFFESPEAAFANLRRSLVPGGRLAFVCWQALDRNPWMSLPLAAAAKHLALPPPPEPGAPGPFAFADADHVRGILAAGGFERATLAALEGRLSPGGVRAPDEAARFLVEMGPAAHALREAGADAALRERVVAEAARALEAFVGADGVMAPYAAWCVTARAPVGARAAPA